jgi:lipoprotein-anchoring transpeptidase ErfK/SrfK
MKYIITILILIALSVPLPLLAFEYSFQTNISKILLPFDTIHSIAVTDLGGDGTSELVLGSPPGFVGIVYIVRLDGSIINSFNPYNEHFRGGVNVAVADLDGDGIPEIITAPDSKGGPHIRIFDGYGKPKISAGFFAGDANYLDGVQISTKRISNNMPPSIIAILKTKPNATYKAFTSIGELVKEYSFENYTTTDNSENFSIQIQKQGESKILSIPKTTKSINKDGKAIVIDLSEQSFSYFEDGFRISTHITSTGAGVYKTPIGEYEINNKAKLAFSNRYGLYMPYWMSFIGGLYGIHELPYWPNGYREGEDHLGKPVSHGCVRLGIGPAEEVFSWAEIGTKVIVQE